MLGGKAGCFVEKKLLDHLNRIPQETQQTSIPKNTCSCKFNTRCLSFLKCASGTSTAQDDLRLYTDMWLKTLRRKRLSQSDRARRAQCQRIPQLLVVQGMVDWALQGCPWLKPDDSQWITSCHSNDEFAESHFLTFRGQGPLLVQEGLATKGPIWAPRFPLVKMCKMWENTAQEDKVTLVHLLKN